MAEYIDRAKIEEIIWRIKSNSDELIKIGEQLSDLKNEDVAPIIHAKWEREYIGEVYRWKCSNCNGFHRAIYNYCPTCGAKMDKED